jgi:hypothetical protein
MQWSSVSRHVLAILDLSLALPTLGARSAMAAAQPGHQDHGAQATGSKAPASPLCALQLAPQPAMSLLAPAQALASASRPERLPGASGNVHRTARGTAAGNRRSSAPLSSSLAPPGIARPPSGERPLAPARSPATAESPPATTGRSGPPGPGNRQDAGKGIQKTPAPAPAPGRPALAGTGPAPSHRAAARAPPRWPPPMMSCSLERSSNQITSSKTAQVQTLRCNPVRADIELFALTVVRIDL